ncbi:MAG: SpoIID/LytB domain-containing protein [Thermoleophilia bacterium]|nr:SpoIID/LytB domain-containing protein [Thermoleophilia bacterium]
MPERATDTGPANLTPLRRWLIAAAVVLAATFALAPAGAGGATWAVKGGGFGHGVGMSQWGAYGMSKKGFSATRIIRHYYRGTRVSKLKKARSVRVLIDVSPSAVRFSGIGRACGRKLSASRTYGARLKRGSVILMRNDGKTLANCGSRLQSESGGRVSFHGFGAYRGGVKVVPTREPRGSLNLINVVPINAYVKGVIANEVISSWPIESLKAQAIAARSFALASGIDGNGFDLYPDTRSQVYGGIPSETARTNRAAKMTSSRVATYRNRVAQTFFFDTSGGRTENVENVWFGEPVPYLKSVKDPYDSISPMHRWTYRFSSSKINSRLSSYLKGGLKRVKVTRRGQSPRVIWARLYGTRGNTAIRGDSLQFALGLPDRLILSFRRK